jgi:flagellar basal-body rod modification protein FlgD
MGRTFFQDGGEKDRPIPCAALVQRLIGAKRTPPEITARALMTAITAASTAAATTTSAASSITSSYDSTKFLSLLMTQLQNQNPLNPTDPSEFTSQIVSYASLEQQINSSASLESMSSTLSSLLTQVQQLASSDAA